MGWFVYFYIPAIIVVFIILFLVIFLVKDDERARAENNIATILLVLLFLSLIATAIYSSIAASDTGGKNADADNKSAHSLYSWGTFFAWLGVFFCVVAVIALIYFRVAYPGASFAYTVSVSLKNQQSGNKTAGTSGKTSGGSKFVKFCLGVILILTAAAGILCAVGAGYQGGSESKKGYRAGIIAATTAIILAVLVLVLIIVIYLKRGTVKKSGNKKGNKAGEIKQDPRKNTENSNRTQTDQSIQTK